MTIVSAYKTHTGLKRKHNEDYLWVNEQAGVYIVADGMGGHEAGDTASSMAATSVGKILMGGLEASAPARTTIKKLMIDAIESANQSVWTASGEAGQKRRMGATIIVALVLPPSAYISHAGDTRAYLIRNNRLLRLTEDDSWAAQLVAAGVISPDDAEHRRNLHFVTKAIGQDAPVNPAFIEKPIEPGDQLLLCSDGLWNMVSDEQILAEFQQAGEDLEQLVDTLIKAANAAGGKDNISVIAIAVY